MRFVLAALVVFVIVEESYAGYQRPCTPAYYGSWGQWSKCSKKCGDEDQYRYRKCIPGNCVYSTKCSGPDREKRSCKLPCCPQDGYWTSWSKYGSCSKTCGGGTQCRSRRCVGRECYGRPCKGSSKDCRGCNDVCCPVDGKWSSWGKYGPCSKTCGGGTQSRSRRCEGRACGGAGCKGNSREQRKCNEECCPQDGKFTPWGKWERCTKTCGGGTQLRARRCEGQKCGGKGCFGTVAQRRPCNKQCCPKDGALTEWGPWGKCSKSCGGGSQSRHRACEGQACGGKGCDPYAPLYEKRSCGTKCCPVDGYWSSWSRYSRCSKTCGGGSQRRSRRCEGRACGGAGCKGKGSESRACNTKCCPKDGSLSEWGPWGKCSKSCGGGSQSRHRACEGQECGGKGCDPYEPLYQNRSCGKKCCPVNGGWSSWSNFGKCSVTCGWGRKYRTRSCTYPAPKCGGRKCRGSSSESVDCDFPPCKKYY